MKRIPPGEVKIMKREIMKKRGENTIRPRKEKNISKRRIIKAKILNLKSKLAIW
jgi:hypothetical protein